VNTKTITAAHEAGTELALAVSGAVSREWIGQQRLARVQVLEVRKGGAPGTERLHYSDRQRAARRTVHVRVLEPPQHSTRMEAGQELWVEPRHLLATWPDYTEARAEHQRLAEQGATTKAAKAAKADQHVAELNELLEAHELPPLAQRTPEHYAESVTTARVTLTLAQVKALLGVTV
jgi:hypothetical protein